MERIMGRVKRFLAIALAGAILFAAGFVLDGRADALYFLGARSLGPLRPLPGSVVGEPGLLRFNGHDARVLPAFIDATPASVLRGYERELAGLVERPEAASIRADVGSFALLAFRDAEGRTCGIAACPAPGGGSRYQLFRSEDADPLPATGGLSLEYGGTRMASYKAPGTAVDHAVLLREDLAARGFSVAGFTAAPGGPDEPLTLSASGESGEILAAVAPDGADHVRVTLVTREARQP